MLPIPTGPDTNMKEFAEAAKTYMEAVRGDSGDSNQKEVHVHNYVTHNHLHLTKESVDASGHKITEKIKIAHDDPRLLEFFNNNPDNNKDNKNGRKKEKQVQGYVEEDYVDV